jgi:prevent-host-death family protein
MSKIVNMHEAKTTLSQLVSEVEQGTEVVLARDGKPVAKLVPFHAAKKRKLGAWKGKVRMSRDFDAPLPAELLAAFEGGS